MGTTASDENLELWVLAAAKCNGLWQVAESVYSSSDPSVGERVRQLT